MPKKIYKRCEPECFCYTVGAVDEHYCVHGPKLKSVTPGQRCFYRLEKLQNQEYDDQGFPMSIPAEKLAEMLKDPKRFNIFEDHAGKNPHRDYSFHPEDSPHLTTAGIFIE